MLTPEQRAVKDRIQRQGRCLQTVTPTPVNFKALLAVAPPIDPNTELGSDPREKAVCELFAPGPVICLNDFITEPGTQNKWQVVYRDNNTADFVVKYMLAKVLTIDT